jgi:hypothetical protein
MVRLADATHMVAPLQKSVTSQSVQISSNMQAMGKREREMLYFPKTRLCSYTTKILSCHLGEDRRQAAHCA